MGNRMKQIRQKSTQYRQNNISLVTDIVLLVTILLLLSLIIFDMFSTGNKFVNLLFTLGTLLLLMVVYFVGIIPALSLNVIMVMILCVWSVHQYMMTGDAIKGMIFWMIMPIFLCLSCYILSQNITKLQSENRMIKAESKALSTVDEETHLRTSEIYKDHFDVFSTLANENHFPIYLYVVQIRYWNAVAGMLSKKDQHELIMIITETIEKYQSGHEFIYYIDNNPPTWAVLSSISNDNIEHLTQQKDIQDVKQFFKTEIFKKIDDHSSLSRVSLQIAMSKITYDPKEHPDATTFLSDGIHELQYDV